MIDLRLGDCLEILPTLAAGSVDAVVTDIPYGEKIDKMGFTKNINGGVTLRNDYSDMPKWDRPITQSHFDLMFSVSDKQLIFGGNFYKLSPSRCWLVWDKKNGGQYSNDFADCEMAWTNLDAPARIIRHVWHGMIQQDMSDKEKRYHPTQKPIAVMKYAIKMMTNRGDTILDPFMGSGTTGVACVQTGRNFIGIEIDSGYFEIAKKRIEQAQLQIRMDI